MGIWGAMFRRGASAAQTVSSNEGGIYCIADIRGHVTHHDASFWIERWHRPALSRAALVLPFLVALGQAQIGKGVPCAKLREDESV